MQDGFAVGGGDLLAAVLLAPGVAEGVPEPDGLVDGVTEGDGDGQTGFTATVRVIVVDGS